MQALSGELFQAPVYPDWGIVGKNVVVKEKERERVLLVLFYTSPYMLPRAEDN